MPEMTDQDLTELKGLMEKATKPTPRPSFAEERADPIVVVFDASEVGMDHVHFRGPNRRVNAAHYIALCNHAHSLIRAKEREKMYRKALEQIAEGNLPCVSGPDDYCHDLMKYARSAPSAFDAQSETRGGG